MSLAFGFALPHWQPLSGGFSPASLFAGGTAGAWYDPSDLTTLFTTSAGTTPVAMPGQGAPVPVGAILDKRATGYSAFCAGAGERYSVPASSAFAYGTGAFTVEAWIYATAINDRFVYSQTTSGQNYFGINVQSTGDINFVFGSGGGTLISTPAAIIATNTWYHVAVVREGTGTNQTKLYVNGVQQAVGTCSFDFTNTTYNPTVGGYTHTTANSFSGYISNLRVVKGAAVYTGAFTPSGPLAAISGTSLLTAGIAWSGNPAFTNAGARVDGLNPFTASPVGNHAIAANDSTKRPVLMARVNLLTYSEEFDNGVWTKGANTTITPNQAIAPDGTLTADLAVGNGTDGVFNASGIAVPSNSNNVKAIYLRSVTGAATVLLKDGQQTIGTTTCNLTTTWQRFSLTETQSGGLARLWVDQIPAAGIYIWGADLRPANIGANVPAYQRIADANTYDTSGFPLYLRFDGVDDSMYTPANLDLSGTDKVAVFAGVRKLSDAAPAALAEFSSAWFANSGAFAIFAPYDTTTNRYAVGGRGTSTGVVGQESYVTGVGAAPDSAVLTGTYDISGDRNIIRRNGTAFPAGTADQGTGNYGTYPLFIGARNNASSWLNGQIYSLIIAGSAVSAGNISATEQWVAGKVGITI